MIFGFGISLTQISLAFVKCWSWEFNKHFQHKKTLYLVDKTYNLVKPKARVSTSGEKYEKVYWLMVEIQQCRCMETGIFLAGRRYEYIDEKIPERLTSSFLEIMLFGFLITLRFITDVI